MKAMVELRQLALSPSLGSYAANDTRPRTHLLDLTLTLDPSRVVIETDGMDRVFDYDPLLDAINRLAHDGHYETQERLLTRILQICASYPDIKAVEIALRKAPVLNDTGSIGLRVRADADALGAIRTGVA